MTTAVIIQREHRIVQSDRLLSLLLTLQARGRVSAADLARELEVSKRTIYRDMDALSAAGIPVYAERGRNGGCVLLPGHRTDVTGLTPDEARALFVFGGGGSSAVGLESSLRSALRKLLAALPERRRPEALHAQQRVIVEAHGWREAPDEEPAADAVRDAIWGDRRLRIRYRAADAQASREQVVDPYGIVVKAGVGYLVAAIAGEPRMYRVSRIEAAEVLDEPSARPPGLDLDALWTELKTRFEARGDEYRITARVRTDLVGRFERLNARSARDLTIVDRGADWTTIQATYPAEGAAVAALLAFGPAAEALEPASLRHAIAVAAEAVARLYAGTSRPPHGPGAAGDAAAAGKA